VASVVVVAVWMAHGVVLSGYPLYPWPYLGLDVDWRVPSEVARELADYTIALQRWGALAAGTAPAPAWPLAWLERHWTLNREFLLPAGFLVAGTIAAVVQALRGGRRAALRLVGAMALGLAGWWWLLPDERFAQGLLWASGLGPLALVVGAGERARGVAWTVVAVLLVAGAFVGRDVGWPRETGLPERPDGQEDAWVLPSGDELRVAASGRGCFALPGARVRDPSLQLRRPGDLAAGFRHAPAP
jgi:hypothetical protein